MSLSASVGSSCTHCTLFLCPKRSSGDASLCLLKMEDLDDSFLKFPTRTATAAAFTTLFQSFFVCSSVSCSAHQPVSLSLTCGWCCMISKKKATPTKLQHKILLLYIVLLKEIQ